MNIGDVATRSGVPVKTIRYYEEIGLVTPKRAANGYRTFDEDDLHRLAFVSRARLLGFSLKDCRTLMTLYDDTGRESAQVKAIAEEHLKEIDHKIAQMQAMRDTLAHMVQCCAGDARPNCPILEDLATGGAIAAPATGSAPD